MSFCDDVDRLKGINQKLLLYDWFVSRYYSWGQLKPLEGLLEKQPDHLSEADKLKGSRRIADILLSANMNFEFRAILMCEGYMLAPNLQKFSHLIESGQFELYRLNFLTCLALWIPTVEGVLRSMLNWKGTRFPKLNQLRNLKAEDQSLQYFVQATADTLVPFLEKSFYNSIDPSRVSRVANFNRHLFSHMSSNASWYCRSNCLRLLNVLDSLLAIDLMVSGMYKPLFDGTSPQVAQRKSYYEFLTSCAFTEAEYTRTRFLDEHPHFKSFLLIA